MAASFSFARNVQGVFPVKITPSSNGANREIRSNLSRSREQTGVKLMNPNSSFSKAYAMVLMTVAVLGNFLSRFKRNDILAIGVGKDPKNRKLQVISLANGALEGLKTAVQIALNAVNPKQYDYLKYAAHNAATGQTLIEVDSKLNQNKIAALGLAIAEYLKQKVDEITQTAELHLATPKNWKGQAMLISDSGEVISLPQGMQFVRMLSDGIVGVKDNSLWSREVDGNWKNIKQFSANKQVKGLDRVNIDKATGEQSTTVYFQEGTCEQCNFKFDATTGVNVQTLDNVDEAFARFTAQSTGALLVGRDTVVAVMFDGAKPTVTYMSPLGMQTNGDKDNSEFAPPIPQSKQEVAIAAQG